MKLFFVMLLASSASLADCTIALNGVNRRIQPQVENILTAKGYTVTATENAALVLNASFQKDFCTLGMSPLQELTTTGQVDVDISVINGNLVSTKTGYTTWTRSANATTVSLVRKLARCE